MRSSVLSLTGILLLAGCSSPPIEKGNNDPVVILNNGNNGGNNANNGPIVTECGPGRTLCSNACVDTALDGANCGGCNLPCAAGTVCSDSMCLPVPADCRAEGECPPKYFCDEGTGLCQAGCSTNADCVAGSFCELETHTCRCTEPGTVVCGGSCVAEAPLSCGPTCESCPGVANGSATCTDGLCGLECAPDHMLCDGSCAPCPTGAGTVEVSCQGNQCVASVCQAGHEICDGQCAACPATNGSESLGCDGTQCVITDCPGGTKLCGGNCAACPDDPNGTTQCSGTQCLLSCGSGFHSCGDYCAANDDPFSCGPNCTSCPTSPNGDAVCSAGACDFICDQGYRACGTVCAPCPDGPGVASTQCSQNTCVVQACAAGWTPCTNGCCQAAPDGPAVVFGSSVTSVSIALDSRGYPHIVYGSASTDGTYYVYWDGAQWNDSFVSTGWDIDVELDTMDRPQVAIWDEPGGSLTWGMMSGGSWLLEEVDFGGVGMTPDIELLGTVPHIAYYDQTSDNLKYATRLATDSWDVDVVEATGQVGFSPSLLMSSGDIPKITYRDETNERLRFAVKYSTGWESYTLDDMVDAGNYSSLQRAVGMTTGFMHVAYEEEPPFVSSNDQVWFMRLDHLGNDIGGRFVATDAARPSLVIDGNNTPHVVYWRPSTSDLMLASRGPSIDGFFTERELVTQNSVGEQNAAVFESATGYIHIAYFDFTNKSVNYISVMP